MPAPIDLTGQRFGRLTVVGLDEDTRKSRKRYWFCECDCTPGLFFPVLAASLRSRRSQSCGCWRVDANRATGAQPKPTKRRECVHCGREFDGAGRSTFCSRRCKLASRVRRTKPRTGPKVDLTGQTFGLWTVLRRAKPRPEDDDHTHYVCRCGGCRRRFRVRGSHLTGGASVACRSCSPGRREVDA